MGKITGINHITFATADLNRSIEFYTKFLEMELVATWNTGAYLLAGELWLCLSYDESTKQIPNNEYTHIALNVDRNGFDELEKLIRNECVTIWKENKSEGKSLYILDPDFNKLEIHASNLKNRIQAMVKNPYAGQKLNHALINKL